MTDETNQPPEPAAYDPASQYRVTLRAAVECPPGSGQWLRPGRRVLVRGDLVPGLGAALATAVKA